jgi:hypothetical protein
MKKVVRDPHYHIWTDALHLRELGRQTTDRWDRGTYVRAAVVMAWTAFETALQDVFPTRRLGERFRRNLDDALDQAGLQPLDWGQGVWQRVAALNAQRVDYVHRPTSDIDLFPDTSVVDDALETIRAALRDLYRRTAKKPPAWIDDDSDRGWLRQGHSLDSAYVTVAKAGVDREDPNTLKVTFTDARGEHIDGYHPPDCDPEELAADLLERVRVPISRITVYRGNLVEIDREFPMRGAP